MALTHLVFSCLAITLVVDGHAASLNVSSEKPVQDVKNVTSDKSVLEIKRRTDVVDEAFLEQKDVLLDMLENKLQEVRDKKKKRSDHSDRDHNVEYNKCDMYLNNVDLNMKSNGISAVGDADVRLKYGTQGSNALKLDATGISNIGKAHLDLDAGDGSIYLPGFVNIFRANSFYDNCTKAREANKQNDGIELPDSKSDYLENLRRGVSNGTTEQVVTLDDAANSSSSATIAGVSGDVNALNVTVSTSANNVTEVSTAAPN